jgi:hypothetical protein
VPIVPDGSDDAELEGVGTPFTVANEFAFVNVRKVLTRNGERLEISAPKLDFRVLLDPVQLEALTWQTPESLSRLLTERPNDEA